MLCTGGIKNISLNLLPTSLLYSFQISPGVYLTLPPAKISLLFSSYLHYNQISYRESSQFNGCLPDTGWDSLDFSI